MAIASGQKITIIFFTRGIKLPADCASHELLPFQWHKPTLLLCKALASQSMVWRQELQLIKERSAPHFLNIHKRQTHPINQVTGITLLLGKKSHKNALVCHCTLERLQTLWWKPRAGSRINTVASKSLQNKDQKLYRHYKIYLHFHCTLLFVTEATLHCCIFF